MDTRQLGQKLVDLGYMDDAQLESIYEEMRTGELKPVVDTVMPLAEARGAHERIEAREHFGKVVLVP